jgi:hypothetical protein
MVQLPALPGFRLEPDVRPTHYALELDFFTSGSRFHGRARIPLSR